MSTVITVRVNEDLELVLKQLTEYYSNPIVSSKNGDVIRYALEKLYEVCYEEEHFRNKFNLPPTLKVICPTCNKMTIHRIDSLVDNLVEIMELIGKGKKDEVGYECQNCGDCFTYNELINGDGRLVLPANEREERNDDTE